MKKKENILSLEQINEFNLNRLGYYCKTRSVWNAKRGKSDYMFDIVQYEGTNEIIIQKGQTRFEFGEHEAMKKRNLEIEYYLKKIQNEM